jgi:HTH-type transcriptional regulator/antitoxin HipB
LKTSPSNIEARLTGANNSNVFWIQNILSLVLFTNKLRLFSITDILMTVYHIRTPDQLRSVLRRLRNAQGLNQTELGQKVGLSQERISAIENHPERVTTDQLLTLLMALGKELVITPRAAQGGSPRSW